MSIRRISRASAALLVALTIGAVPAMAVPTSSAFTYQGRLTDNGAPANGPYDFFIRLYDSASGGNGIGPFFTLNDINVDEGLFTLTLDFGASAFTGEARWLDIQVRPGASGGLYTWLTPRQPLSAAPYALYALNAGSWIKNGAAMTNSNAGFVGINRSTPVGSSEYFGVQAPVQSGYGGMYMRTDGAAGKPFYGYFTGSQSVWSYLDGPSGAWRLYNDGDRVTVTNSGNVGVGTTSPSAKLHVHNQAGSTNNSLYAVTYGSGRAASFESHQSNTTPAVSIYKNQGVALKTTGDVHINGKIYSEIGGSQKRATPIAYCTFTAENTPQILTSSGNVSVGFNFDPNFPAWLVSVTGETNPDSWIVLSNLAVQSPHLSNRIYNLRTGIPENNGIIRVAMQCVLGCNDPDQQGTKAISLVVYKP